MVLKKVTCFHKFEFSHRAFFAICLKYKEEQVEMSSPCQGD
jgi:hypothetical protein